MFVIERLTQHMNVNCNVIFFSIELGDRLGEGAFGEVYRASFCTTIPLIDSTGQKVTVAVKRLKGIITHPCVTTFIII
jgi:Protein tyrosine and serine/threonine kinase